MVNDEKIYKIVTQSIYKIIQKYIKNYIHNLDLKVAMEGASKLDIGRQFQSDMVFGDAGHF